MLLGVDGVCIISHGSSSAKAIVNAIGWRRRVVEDGRRGAAGRGRRRLTDRTAGTGGATLTDAATQDQEAVSARRDPRRAGPARPRRQSSRSCATDWPTSSRSSPATISEGQSFVDDLDADSLALIELVEALEEELGERTSASASRTRTSRT